MTLVQIARREGEILRVPNSERPVVELHLKPNERVIEIQISENYGTRERVTTDWRWVAYTEWRDPTNEHEPTADLPKEPR